MLAATARVLDLTLVTADARRRAGTGHATLANRLPPMHPRLLLLFVAVVAACASPRDRGTAAGTDAVPDSTPEWLHNRAVEEVQLSRPPAVPHDFWFEDRAAASGLTFVNRIVDDAGKAYKALHYDHGTGVCAADVEGDGDIDLYFVSQRGTDMLALNDGRGRFTDGTAAAGVATPDRIGVTCAFGDIDNDGRPDLFVTTVRHGNRLYRNLGGGRFADVTVLAGVGHVGHSSGAAFLDYDGDGRLDLFVTNVGRYTTNDTGPGGYFIGVGDAFQGHLHPDRAEASLLYRNLGDGRFAEVSRDVGLVELGWNGDVTVLDVDEDGRPDLYLPNMQGENRLWRNVDGRRFQDETARWFPRTPWGAMGVKAFDFNGDGRRDLFVTDMHSDMIDILDPADWGGKRRKTASAHVMDAMLPTGRARLLFGNALYAARPEGAPFAEVSDSLGVETWWPWGPSADDLNADGWDDLFITAGMNFPYPYAPNDLLLNDQGRRFVPSAFRLGVEPRRGGKTVQPWFTVQCGPGGADAATKSCEVCRSPQAAQAGCRMAADGTATMDAARASRSSVIADLDGDGDLDIVTNEFNAAPQLLVSSLAARSRVQWLAVRLRGTTSNRQGLGARVTVTLPGGRRLVKWNDGQSGYLSHSDLPLYFGLGDATTVTAIEVRWPSGRTQVVPAPAGTRRVLEVVER